MDGELAVDVLQKLGDRARADVKGTPDSDVGVPARDQFEGAYLAPGKLAERCGGRIEHRAGVSAGSDFVALGAQAGEARLRKAATDAGFTRFRRVAETPTNIVLEVQP